MKKYTNKILVGGAIFYTLLTFAALLLIRNDLKRSAEQNEQIINQEIPVE